MYFLDTSDHKAVVGIHTKTKKLALVFIAQSLIFEPLSPHENTSTQFNNFTYSSVLS